MFPNGNTSSSHSNGNEELEKKLSIGDWYAGVQWSKHWLASPSGFQLHAAKQERIWLNRRLAYVGALSGVERLDPAARRTQIARWTSSTKSSSIGG